jgi:hypothetical protein
VRGPGEVGGHRRGRVTPRGAELRCGEQEGTASRAPRTSAPRRSAPRSSARSRSTPRRSAPTSRAPRRRAARRSRRRRSAPTRSAPRRSGPGDPACAAATRSSNSAPASRRTAPTSIPASASGSRATIASTRADSTAASSPTVGDRAASSSSASTSCSGRRTSRASNIAGTRRVAPPNVTCTTCCPAPKQSNTTQPGKPRPRRRSWIAHPWSGARCGQGVRAGLSIAKSAEAANAGPTQHSARHREQSADRPAVPAPVTPSAPGALAPLGAVAGERLERLEGALDEASKLLHQGVSLLVRAVPLHRASPRAAAPRSPRSRDRHTPPDGRHGARSGVTSRLAATPGRARQQVQSPVLRCSSTVSGEGGLPRHATDRSVRTPRGTERDHRTSARCPAPRRDDQ